MADKSQNDGPGRWGAVDAFDLTTVDGIVFRASPDNAMRATLPGGPTLVMGRRESMGAFRARAKGKLTQLRRKKLERLGAKVGTLFAKELKSSEPLR